jgi:Right handed beta helix region
MPAQPAHPARHLVLVAVLALGLLALAAGPALAQPLGCGAVVTQDTTFTSDLLQCPGNGLVIGADGITVDLNGHTISGQIISAGSPDQVGIENRGHDDVTIRNGTVTVFARGGVLLVGVDRNRIQDLTMDFFDEFSIQLEGGGSANQFTGNHMARPGTSGISILGAAAASRDNVIRGNGIDAANSANIALRSGRITGTLIEDNFGVAVESDGNRTLIWRNTPSPPPCSSPARCRDPGRRRRRGQPGRGQHH